jgi:predicted RNA binding protein YcfA (HicA-like mRNA interferase family)
MPKLRRLNGKQVMKILEDFNFQVVRIRGSHHQLQRIVNGRRQNLTVPIHGSQPLTIGTLRSIYREACTYIPQEDIESLFFGD